MKLSKKLFYLIILVLPLNLGKHFVLQNSFVKGLLVDYLVPTLYVQDILLAVLCCVWAFELFRSVKTDGPALKTPFFPKNSKTTFDKKLAPVYFFVFSLLLSTFVSSIFAVSLLSFFRTLLYFLFFLYIYTNLNFSKDLSLVMRISFLSFFLVSILGIVQFIKQKSVFSNYLFFGEQPYSFSTQGIVHESVLGFTVVPPYGLFKHPNALGGILSILLVWLIPFLKKSKLYYVYFLTIFLVLILTFSWCSYASFFTGALYYYFVTSKKIKFKQTARSFVLLILATIVLVLSLIMPFFIKYLSEADLNSVTRRAGLLEGSYKLIQDNFYYGVGFNSYTTEGGAYLPYLNAVRFLQPVHNVFVLIFSESGVASFVLFLVVLGLTFLYTRHVVLTVSLVQVVLLSSFDHYFWTMHQPHLFLWIILGLCWTSLREC